VTSHDQTDVTAGIVCRRVNALELSALRWVTVRAIAALEALEGL
jgi:hypothetical protein